MKTEYWLIKLEWIKKCKEVEEFTPMKIFLADSCHSQMTEVSEARDSPYLVGNTFLPHLDEYD